METQNRLYSDLAWLWPIVSPPQEYQDEAEAFRRSLTEFAERPIRNVLHLGCGGGHGDYWLKRHFSVVGVDLSSAMISLAGKLNPEVEYLLGDMRTVRLGRKFDAVIFSDAIMYMLSPTDLLSAFTTARAHLETGGLLSTYIELEKTRFQQNAIVTTVKDFDGGSVVMIENYFDPDRSDTTFELTFVYLIRRSGKLAIETDRHLCGVLEIRCWREQLNRAGFREIENSITIENCPFLIGQAATTSSERHAMLPGNVRSGQ